MLDVSGEDRGKAGGTRFRGLGLHTSGTGGGNGSLVTGSGSVSAAPDEASAGSGGRGGRGNFGEVIAVGCSLRHFLDARASKIVWSEGTLAFGLWLEKCREAEQREAWERTQWVEKSSWKRVIVVMVAGLAMKQDLNS
ncbi:hypothetical protein DL96DRAFT_1685696 [Flagelloscypha sp. PMI_526]|nr:hypothetical protein DL96DRAFT_1685696 [Flagelloscypha sp. PMI_526]